MSEAVDRAVLAKLGDPNDGGDPEFLAELIDVFLEDVAPRMEALLLAERAGDPHALARAAHSLKGSSGSIGAWAMHVICDSLEKLGQNGSTVGARDLLDVLEAEFTSVRAELGEARRRYSP